MRRWPTDSINSWRFLKKGGQLFFILPNTFLRVKGFKFIRDFIKNNFIIDEIINIGRAFEDVGYEMIILKLTKKNGHSQPENIKITNLVNSSKLRLSFRIFEISGSSIGSFSSYNSSNI